MHKACTFCAKPMFSMHEIVLFPTYPKDSRAARTTLKTCPDPGPNARRDEISRSMEPLTPIIYIYIYIYIPQTPPPGSRHIRFSSFLVDSSPGLLVCWMAAWLVGLITKVSAVWWGEQFLLVASCRPSHRKIKAPTPPPS